MSPIRRVRTSDAYRVSALVESCASSSFDWRVVRWRSSAALTAIRMFNCENRRVAIDESFARKGYKDDGAALRNTGALANTVSCSYTSLVNYLPNVPYTHSALRPRDTAFEREAIPWIDDVHRFALSLTRDECDADDVVQDTFLRAYRSWHTYLPGSDCRRWLFTICRNVFLRSRERYRPTVELEASEIDAAVTGSLYGGAERARRRADASRPRAGHRRTRSTTSRSRSAPRC